MLSMPIEKSHLYTFPDVDGGMTVLDIFNLEPNQITLFEAVSIFSQDAVGAKPDIGIFSAADGPRAAFSII
jgi:hypothetical protein